MRITGVSVKKLFGIFDHNVPLNSSEHITIMHGPNGFGKTILLTMINDLFTRNYSILLRIPYQEFSVSFDDNRNIRISKHSDTRNIELRNALNIELLQNEKIIGSFDVKMPRHQDLGFPPELITQLIPELQRISQDTWLHLPSQEQLSIYEIFDRYSTQLPPAFRRDKLYKEEEWFTEIIKSVSIHFIVAQRLFRFSRYTKSHELPNRSSMVPTVEAYSMELANALQSKLAEYGVLSQSLERTFPARLIKSSNVQNINVNQILDSLEKLENKRSSLIKTGLLDKGGEIDDRIFSFEITDSNKEALSIYVADAVTKLKVFEDLATKIELLMNMINKRFLYKTMSVNKKDGFVFKSFVGDTLTPAMLSSGEQHEIVLLYELLFQVNPGSLILIDEPELSLHIIWQQQFLGDLQQITKISNFDALIATHSPQIIHNRQDLMVDLKGPELAQVPNS